MPDEKMDLDAFWELPEIMDSFPLKFGRAKWLEFTGHCARCREDILRVHLRGGVHPVDARTFKLEALGYCESCNLITRYAYHLHDDMSITGKSPSSGEPARWTPETSEQGLQ